MNQFFPGDLDPDEVPEVMRDIADPEELTPELQREIDRVLNYWWSLPRTPIVYVPVQVTPLQFVLMMALSGKKIENKKRLRIPEFLGRWTVGKDLLPEHRHLALAFGLDEAPELEAAGYDFIHELIMANDFNGFDMLKSVEEEPGALLPVKKTPPRWTSWKWPEGDEEVDEFRSLAIKLLKEYKAKGPRYI